MRRELLIAVGAATIVTAGVAGCSHGNKSAGTTTPSGVTASSSSPTTVSGTASREAGSAKVTIDGHPQNVGGPVVCSTTNGKFSIDIGEPLTGVFVALEPDASVVHNVALNNVEGVVLSVGKSAPGSNASATKDGNNYRITGTATGVDMANPVQQVSKSFEIDVTCP